MNFVTAPWNALIDFLSSSLTVIHDVLEPLFGMDVAWGWAIIALTLIVRVLMLPLAIKQTRSMRGMQTIQPRVKEIQDKYKTDREMMRKDPERYQKLKSKQQEELMELYQAEGVNPAASCLPLLLQMPIFFALFRVLQELDPLADATFYFFTDFVSADAEASGLGASVSQAGWPGWLLIVLMSATMFITQRQMMARNAAEGPAATQQKIMMYVFPVFLAFISFNFPLAVVLYWVTTNMWQGVQQWIMFRVTHDDEPGAAQQAGATRPDKGPSSGTGTSSPSGKKNTSRSSNPGASSGRQTKRSTGGGGHLPKKKRPI